MSVSEGTRAAVRQRPIEYPVYRVYAHARPCFLVTPQRCSNASPYLTAPPQRDILLRCQRFVVHTEAFNTNVNGNVGDVLM